jgi:hypothetical protein
MGAVISDCGKYRYRLDRELGDGYRVVGIMVNPSTADAETDDATIRKWLGFARRNGWGRVTIGNKFAFRATDIKRLREAGDRIGPDNDRYLEQIMREADLLIVAWGTLGKIPESLRSRWKDIVRMADHAGRKLHCFGTAQDGHPLHPLMLGYDTKVIEWEAPWFANRQAA